MALLDGVLGRNQPRFDDATGAPAADERKKGPRPGPADVQPAGAAADETDDLLTPARSHLGRVIDLVG
jgi:hypothetical protein